MGQPTSAGSDMSEQMDINEYKANEIEKNITCSEQAEKRTKNVVGAKYHRKADKCTNKYWREQVVGEKYKSVLMSTKECRQDMVRAGHCRWSEQSGGLAQ
jgi:hypothetical protein